MAITHLIRVGTETVRSLIAGMGAVSPLRMDSAWKSNVQPKTASADLAEVLGEIAVFAVEYAGGERQRLTAITSIGEDRLNLIREKVAAQRAEAEKQRDFMGVQYDASGTKIVGYTYFKKA
jgi:hypothetical protein